MLHPHLGDIMGLEYHRKGQKCKSNIFRSKSEGCQTEIQQQIKKGRILLVYLLWPRQQNWMKFMCRCEFCDIFSILWMTIDHVYLYLYLSIQLSMYIRFLSIYLPIFITVSPPIYISTYLSIFVFFSLRVSNYQDKNKLKMYTAMCWVAEGPHRFMKLFVALSIFFITFCGYNEKLTALLRDWVQVHKKTRTSSSAILNRTKGKTWRAVRKEENIHSELR